MGVDKKYCVRIVLNESEDRIKCSILNWEDRMVYLRANCIAVFGIFVQYEDEAIGLRDILKRVFRKCLERELSTHQVISLLEKINDIIIALNLQILSRSQFHEIEMNGNMEECEIILHYHSFYVELVDAKDKSCIEMYVGKAVAVREMMEIIKICFGSV